LGYHWYINRNGLISQGRQEQYAGAHVMGHNHHSIGICYEGGLDEQGNAADTRTSAQRQALLHLLKRTEAAVSSRRDLWAPRFPQCPQSLPLL